MYTTHTDHLRRSHTCHTRGRCGVPGQLEKACSLMLTGPAGSMISLYGCQLLRTAYCVRLFTENIFVCCCCVGSDRVAGVRGMQALGLVRDNGRPCLGRCSLTTQLFPVYDLCQIDGSNFQHRHGSSGSASTGPGFLTERPGAIPGNHNQKSPPHGDFLPAWPKRELAMGTFSKCSS